MWKATTRWHRGKHPCIRGYYHFLDSIVDYVGLLNIHVGRYGTIRYHPKKDLFNPTIYDAQKKELKIIAKGNGFFEEIRVKVEPDYLLMILLMLKYYPDKEFLPEAKKDYQDRPEIAQKDFGRFYPHPLEPYLQNSFSEFNLACQTPTPDSKASLDTRIEPQIAPIPPLPLEELVKAK